MPSETVRLPGERHNPTSAEVLERATANWDRKRHELGLDPAPFPSTRNDFINQAFRELSDEARIAAEEARDA